MTDTNKKKIVILLSEQTEPDIADLITQTISVLETSDTYEIETCGSIQKIAKTIKNGGYHLLICPEKDGNTVINIFTVRKWFREHLIDRCILIMPEKQRATLKSMEMISNRLYDGFFMDRSEPPSRLLINLRFLIDNPRSLEAAEEYYSRQPSAGAISQESPAETGMALIALDLIKNDARVAELTSALRNRLPKGMAVSGVVHVNTKKEFNRMIAEHNYDIIICSNILKGEMITIPAMKACLSLGKARVLIPVIAKDLLPSGRRATEELMDKGFYNALYEDDISGTAVYKILTGTGRTKKEAEEYYRLDSTDRYAGRRTEDYKEGRIPAPEIELTEENGKGVFHKLITAARNLFGAEEKGA